MRRREYYPLIILVVFIFSVLSMPRSFSEGVRSVSVATVFPFWRLAAATQRVATAPVRWLKDAVFATSSELREENRRLVLENQHYREELERFGQLLLQEQYIEYHLSRLREVAGQKMGEDGVRHYQELSQLLQYQLQAIPATVIAREPATWSSVLWLNAGTADNERLEREVVAVNSPILVGSSLVGIVDEVHRRRCRVRLLTDSRVHPSVRSSRGHHQALFFGEQIHSLLQLLSIGPEELHPMTEKDTLLTALEQWHHDMMSTNKESWLLAKGFLQGTGAPLWRSGGKTLRGIGFNFEYHDTTGPARALLSGMPIDDESNTPDMPIIKVGDVLVTTGLDGIFPPGLHTAIVTAIDTLKEGGYSYHIDATPTAHNINNLSLVTIIPPLEGDGVPLTAQGGRVR